MPEAHTEETVVKVDENRIITTREEEDGTRATVWLRKISVHHEDEEGAIQAAEDLIPK